MLFDLDASYLVNDRVALVGGLRRHDLDQEGDFTFATILNRGQWDLTTTGVEGAAQVSVAPEVTVTGGLRYETRDVTFAHGEDVGGIALGSEEEQTDHTGFFSDVSWTPSRRLRVSGEVELSSHDYTAVEAPGPTRRTRSTPTSVPISPPTWSPASTVTTSATMSRPSRRSSSGSPEAARDPPTRPRDARRADGMGCAPRDGRLVVELVSLLWNHHLAFLLFLIVGTALIVAGAALFLWATFAHAPPEGHIAPPEPRAAP